MKAIAYVIHIAATLVLGSAIIDLSPSLKIAAFGAAIAIAISNFVIGLETR